MGAIASLPVVLSKLPGGKAFRQERFDTGLKFVLRKRLARGMTMHHLSRFGVSLEDDLLQAFDRSIGGQSYQNRSEAIRDLIQDHLIQKKDRPSGYRSHRGGHPRV